MDIPEAARAHTEAGAIEFTKVAVTMAGKSFAENDSAPFMSLTDPGCKGCTAVATEIANQVASDRHPAEPRITIDDVQLFSPYTGDRVEVDVLGKEKATTMVNSAGKVVGQLDEAVLRLRLGLLWTEGGWRVGEMMVVNV